MLHTARLVRSPLGAQVVLMVLCTAGMLAWWQWSSDDLARRTKRHDLIHRIDAEVRTASKQPSIFALGDPEGKSLYNRTMGTVRSHTDTLQADDQEISEAVAAVVADLEAFDAHASRIWSSPAPGALVAQLNVQAATLRDSVEVLHDLDAGLKQARSRLYFQGFIWLWAGTLGIYLTTVWWGRRWLVARRAAEREERRVSVDSAVSALAHASAGLFTEPCVPHPELRALTEGVEAFIEHLDTVRGDAARRQRAANFTQELGLALDLADTELAVKRTTARAAAEAFPNAELQIWMADNSHSTLEPRCADGPVVCGADQPYACPAIRRSSVEVNLPGNSLARCPHLGEDERVVTCSFLSIGGRAAGVVQLVGRELDVERRSSLAEMTRSVGRRLSVVRTLGERELQASTDVLTGLANRRKMNDRLASLERSESPYAVVACDLDHFKRLNDTYGHEIGDRCLKVFAQVLRNCVSGAELACRPGGEEFLVILPGADAEQGARFGEAVRAELQKANLASGIGFTVSIGVAACPQHGNTAEGVQRIADAALYRAKGAGRDRVCVGEDEVMNQVHVA